jgi:hypothetical protein
MGPTPHVGMLNTMNNLEETIFTNVGIDVDFICSLSFQNDPICMWHGSLFEQLPNTQKMSLHFSTHTQNKKKRIIKITNLENSIEKTKRKENENQQLKRDK